MKKFIAITCLFCLFIEATPSFADIQAPLAGRYGKSRKLGRAIGNLLYHWTEIPTEMGKTLDSDGDTAEWSYGIVQGIKKSTVRVGYGFYELFTFGSPTYKNGYRPPYYRSIHMNPYDGYEEFPPQLGILKDHDYSKHQNW